MIWPVKNLENRNEATQGTSKAIIILWVCTTSSRDVQAVYKGPTCLPQQKLSPALLGVIRGARPLLVSISTPLTPPA